jgi:drug/metabolite transporter (DMT)-like permease
VFFGERPTVRFMFAVAMAFAGLWMLIGGDWFAATREYRIGVGYGLLTAFLYSLYLLTLRRAQSVTPRLSAESNLFWICVISAALLGPAALATGESLTIPDKGSALALLALGVFPQVVGWTLISRALPYLRAGLAGLILLGQPALSFVWDVIFFGRPTTAIEATGAVLALVGIYLGTMATAGAGAGSPSRVSSNDENPSKS